MPSKQTEQTKNREEIINWIAARHCEEIQVGPETDLLGSGLVDSLQMMEFILFLEELSGKELDLENIDPSAFKTIATIESEILNATEVA